MRSRDLDRRIQFRRFGLVDDGFSEVEDWADHGTRIWAKKVDLSDGEKWRAGEVAASMMSRFVVPSSAFTRGLTPKDGLIHNGVVYGIIGIKESGGRRRWLEITAAVRTDT